MKIDIYSHILTQKYLDVIFKYVPSPMVGKKMLETQPTLPGRPGMKTAIQLLLLWPVTCMVVPAETLP